MWKSTFKFTRHCSYLFTTYYMPPLRRPALSQGQYIPRLSRWGNISRGVHFCPLNPAARPHHILDEPSIGLHQRDNDRLLKTLTDLRDMGNSVIVVEHDEDAIKMADWVLDIGPGAGVHGGEIIAYGTPEQVMKNKNSLTGQYLSGKKRIEIPTERAVNDPTRQLTVRGATGNNLQNVDLHIPVGLFTCITGVSGSGKSTLINQTLYPLAQAHGTG